MKRKQNYFENARKILNDVTFSTKIILVLIFMLFFLDIFDFKINLIILLFSLLIINILYYIEDLSNKEVILVPYKSDRTHHYITCNDNIIKLSMPSWRTRGYMGGIYNNFTFKGKLINGVEKDSDILDRWTFQTGTFLK